MKSLPKLIRRFIGILLLSVFLLFFINLAIFVLIMFRQIPSISDSPYYMASEIGNALISSKHGYVLPEEFARKLSQKSVWAVSIDNDTLQVVWKTDNVPDTIPDHYTLNDIATISTGYLEGYPAYIGKTQNGIVILGFPKESYWKHTQASWNYHFIASLPRLFLIVLIVNIILIFSIYAVANMKLWKSIRPITKGIQDLAAGNIVQLPETGVLSEISENINHTSSVLQEQKEQLKKKEMARANWIAGVSHDIRTPLSMIMGYAGQLEFSSQLNDSERQKASGIVKQSGRIRELINDLNLASKLEYNMQPLNAQTINAVAIVRQAVVQFINMNINDCFPIKWTTSDSLSECRICADANLLKRAILNLIQNSMNHNEDGCTIYVSVTSENGQCTICVEDNGIGVSDEQITALKTAPHYMVCDSNTTTQRHGLGLLIVKQILEAHHGSVLIDHSTYGGFKVNLLLPLTTD